ncbi:MAG: cytochrome c peroxidase [Polyangiaceae bacterium]
MRTWLGSCVVALTGFACSAQPESSSARSLTVREAPPGYPSGVLAAVAPASSPLTEPRAELGRRLFFDKRLSSNNSVACATCHQQQYAFSDPDAVSTGVGGLMGTRNASALVNLAWGTHFFWDGRAGSLEEQSTQPIENRIEMALPLTEAIERLNNDSSYVAAFSAAFGAPPQLESLQQALASFVRTLVSSDSPYDQHLRGDDHAFGPGAQRGEALFLSERAACFHCHPGGRLTNGGFFNNGTFVDGGDVGRAAVTHLSGDVGKFKVPTLRNVAFTAPYMHDGSLATLSEVIDQYARGGRGDPTTDPQIKPLSLAEDEKADLIEFLLALSDEQFTNDHRYSAERGLVLGCVRGQGPSC